ncbi:glutamate synthase domain-containing protein 1 [Paenibacillus shirakamiensis]|uniref:Glutamate synthase domain-containing protein 1 n=1 Tax=Paenibacillus shirakamiensis TaxID=1265935 RepID=A0ABS4JJQ2_9BACL|nr:hypothetical protein [Paenibacillus shirakamiensis]MBP2001934.1 glutamate synthase domain-containing protein 1 [Paenibacillus shirakamiensis]
MDPKEIEKQVIAQYQQEENMMILIFAQWCVNHDLDPNTLYARAYPQQQENVALEQGIALTVSKEEAGDIDDDTLLSVLSLFGNEDLAFVVTEEIQRREKNNASR